MRGGINSSTAREISILPLDPPKNQRNLRESAVRLAVAADLAIGCGHSRKPAIGAGCNTVTDARTVPELTLLPNICLQESDVSAVGFGVAVGVP